MRNLIHQIPGFSPTERSIAFNRVFHTKSNGCKSNEGIDDGKVNRNENCIFDSGRAVTSEMIQQERNHQNGKVKCGEIMVQISHTPHDEKGNIMEEPTKEQCFSNIEEMIPLSYITKLNFSCQKWH